MSEGRNRIYIAGPMRGRPYYNFPAFDRERDIWQTDGWEVVSPADLDRRNGFDALDCAPDTDWNAIPDGFDFDACVARDLAGLLGCHAIYMLDGWARSRGACAEKAVAEWTGLQVYYQTPPPSTDAARCGVRAELPADAEERKAIPLYRGLFCYFPNALIAVARCSYEGNRQHHPDKPLHWDRSKSTDEEDALLRHLLEGDYQKVAWRALALYERRAGGEA